ncbi:MAG: fibronectin type III domain-containing protein [Eubacteriales bacterium]|nr:fibronectin type III domain-containing protein [Eubacteriales bacterium]
MNKIFKKSVAALMGTLMIGSVALPAMAVEKADEDSNVVIQRENEITPQTANISLNTFSTSSSIKVAWVRPNGAVRYVVTCGSQSQPLNSSESNPSVIFTGLSSKTSYSITVKAYNSSGTIIAAGFTTASTR